MKQKPDGNPKRFIKIDLEHFMSSYRLNLSGCRIAKKGQNKTLKLARKTKSSKQIEIRDNGEVSCQIPLYLVSHSTT